MHSKEMAIEGLPLRRQERGANDQDILAGADFLSVFMESSLRRAFSETTSTTAPTTIVIVEEENTPQQTPTTIFTRPSRSTHSFAQTTEQLHVSDRNLISSDSSDSEEGVIVAVRVSSSVGRSVNKEQFHNVDSTTFQQTITLTTTELPDQSFVASEEHPSIVAAVSKSELSVEETDPITKDSDIVQDFSGGYPASVRELPNQARSSYDPTAGFIDQASSKDTKQPYQTVIYHDNPSEGARARSVSYSSIIQALPQASAETDKSAPHDRHERNYNGAGSPYSNIYNSNSAKPNNTRSGNPVTQWKKNSNGQINPTTEKNWETQEKPYVPPSPTPAHLPKVFGRPEQNYEVDEAVSVVTNGRTHGVQPSVPSKPEKKEEDNQKVGYVVEGRNYRRYRVEERTPDGFIVGEYGVVSHDDGSLRGVRYTADGTINPKLISEALLKFLSL
nr:uncharacterized protein LOC111509003 [Leptinotarsa decemlineata]